MSGVTKQKIYENSEILKRTIGATLLSLNMPSDNIIFINISYFDGQGNGTVYSGMKYIANLRAEKKDNSPVVFYGFESLKSLKKKPEASIFNSPAVGYIQMPFLISGLDRIINKLTNYKIIEKPLDKKTERELALERISGFKHDMRNAAILLNQHIQGLKSEDKERKKEKWDVLSQFSDDFLEKRTKRYDQMKNIIINSFPKNKHIASIPDILDKANDNYVALKAIIKNSKYNEKSLANIIKKGEEVVVSIKTIETILTEVQNGR